MFVYQVESLLWHCSIYFLPHCFSLHLQRLRAILAIHFSSEGGPRGPFLLPASCVFVRWAVDSQIWSLCNDWWLVEITYIVDRAGQGEMVSRSWQSGAQPPWDQSPSYFIRQMCFSEDSRVNGTGASCQDCCLISGGYVRGDTLSIPFIHPSLLIPGHATRRERSGGDTCPQWGRLVLKVLMGGKSY